MLREEIQNNLIDKVIYLTGYFKGIANVLRSSGNVDPLALSADFESISRDMLLIQESVTQLCMPEEETIEEELKRIEEFHREDNDEWLPDEDKEE